MSDSIIAIEFGYLDFVPETSVNVEKALVRTLNAAADRTRTRASRTVLEQVAFPASYLGPSAKRLSVSQRAKPGSYMATIRGRGEATSLARFTKQKPLGGGQRHKGGKINVTVKPGQRRSISRAFLIRLKNSNIGLAVRTNGNEPTNAYKPKLIGKNLWLLYGPSVDQALRSASTGDGVYEELTPETLDFLENEFNRQLDLLEKTNG